MGEGAGRMPAGAVLKRRQLFDKPDAIILYAKFFVVLTAVPHQPAASVRANPQGRFSASQYTGLRPSRADAPDHSAIRRVIVCPFASAFTPKPPSSRWTKAV